MFCLVHIIGVLWKSISGSSLTGIKLRQWISQLLSRSLILGTISRRALLHHACVCVLLTFAATPVCFILAACLCTISCEVSRPFPIVFFGSFGSDGPCVRVPQILPWLHTPQNSCSNCTARSFKICWIRHPVATVLAARQPPLQSTPTPSLRCGIMCRV